MMSARHARRNERSSNAKSTARLLKLANDEIPDAVLRKSSWTGGVSTSRRIIVETG